MHSSFWLSVLETRASFQLGRRDPSIHEFMFMVIVSFRISSYGTFLLRSCATWLCMWECSPQIISFSLFSFVTTRYE